MKMKHNKKRNTAFLYETLVREMTKCVISKDKIKKNQILSILKEHFSKGKVLNKELFLYKNINETSGLKRDIAEKILKETKYDYELLSKDEIFLEQSKVINKINKNISPSVFSNFVSNYKNLASIAQIFSGSLSPKERVLLEETILEKMSENGSTEEVVMKPLDDLTYKTFIKKFNEKYSDSLLSEQKDLLTNYFLSLDDNGLSLKIYLNEELGRIKEEIKNCFSLQEIKQDENMSNKAQIVFEKLEQFKKQEFDQKMLTELLKIQYFVSEAKNNGN